MNNVKRYQQLASKWLNGTITEEEKIEFSQWYNNHNDEDVSIPTSFARKEAEIRERILLKIQQGLHPVVADNTRRRFSKGWAIAASFALFCLCGLVYYAYIKQPDLVEQTVTLDDIKPGGNKAILTLPDGQTINLDGQKEGLTVAGDLQYIDGSAIWEADDMSESIVTDAYVTLSTPKGGQYQVKLPDGSEVWLNSASSLRFPKVFNKQYREVELVSGEAYFQVNAAKKEDEKVPFYVKNGIQLIEVLGTGFNVNMYEADQGGVVTTVADGIVTVESLGGTDEAPTNKVELTTGKQSVTKNQEIHVNEVDPERVIAWKEGYFSFDDADIYTVMKEFERWYDIEARYEIATSDDRFVGKIPKDVSLGTALHVLNRAGVKFEMSGAKQLIIKDR